MSSVLLTHLLTSLRLAFSWKSGILYKIRAEWAKPASKHAWLASRLFELTRDAADLGKVDDRTWSDLEFDRLFATMDSTLTPLGSQCLYRLLRTYVDEAAQLDAQYRLFHLLGEQDSLREQILLSMAPLQNDSNALLCESLFGTPAKTPRFIAVVVLSSLASIAACLATFFNHTLGWLFGSLIVCNIVILYLVEQQFHDVYSTASRVGSMVGIATRLARIESNPSIPQIDALRATLRDAGDLKHAFRWFLAKRDDSIIGSFFFYLQVLFLVDLVAGTIAVKRLHRFRFTLATVFELIGSLDASIAIASLLRRLPQHCKPLITGEPLIDMTAGYHPILSNPVANSISLIKQSALIVGSNMAGKTTFIKMVGTNIILGRTIGVCFAHWARIPQSVVMASIRAEHSMESGKSHFFAEIERILSFLHSAEQRACGVFLIDELFRGTNTLERVAAGKAVLDALARRSQVLATTHDVELQGLLGANFTVFHFTENPDLQQIFDYQVRPGVSSARNAIRLLELIGFPPSIVNEARRIVDGGAAKSPT